MQYLLTTTVTDVTPGSPVYAKKTLWPKTRLSDGEGGLSTPREGEPVEFGAKGSCTAIENQQPRLRGKGAPEDGRRAL